ncbi:MAG: carboxypeptidase regulatory-like domain-containing protein [Acidobacteriota bacterium]
MGVLGACLAAPLSADAQTGSITGTVTTKAAAPRPLRVTIDQRICGDELPDESIVVGAGGALAHAVVTLTGIKAGAAGAAPVVMNEKCRFVPRVQVVRPNVEMTTSSRDPVLHTTQAQLLDGSTLFNVALPIPGITIRRPVGSARVVRLGCNTHPWMRGWMIVTDEVAAVTGADGRFTLAGVPPGTYELRVWHETLQGAPQKVTVAAGTTAQAAFVLQ